MTPVLLYLYSQSELLTMASSLQLLTRDGDIDIDDEAPSDRLRTTGVSEWPLLGSCPLRIQRANGG